MPLRQPQVPAHDARAQALTDDGHRTTTMTHVVHHLQWGAEALWESLCPLLPGISVEVQARVESTNTRLLERARALSGNPDSPVTRPGELDGPARAERTPHGRRSGDISPCLLVAEEQTRGRGRLGRNWISSAGASLSFSLSMPLAPVQWGGLSLAVGLALAEALDPQPLGAALGDELRGGASASLSTADTAARPRIGLKWPNDLWLVDGPGRGRKLGGVLIETVTVGQHRLCVVGVGLNVLPQPAGGAQGLASGYACLQELDPGASAPAALARVTPRLARALRRFEAQGFAPLVAAYQRRDLLRGQTVSITVPEALQATAEGVDDQGALLVRSGALHRVVSGEVSVRLGTG